MSPLLSLKISHCLFGWLIEGPGGLRTLHELFEADRQKKLDTIVFNGYVNTVDPATGTVHPAGSLPHPLSDAAAVADGGRILVIGGRDAAGRVSDEIVELKPAR